MKQNLILFVFLSILVLHQTTYSVSLSAFNSLENGLEYWQKNSKDNTALMNKLQLFLCTASAVAGIGLRIHYLYKALNSNNKKKLTTMNETNKASVTAPVSLFIVLIEKVLPLLRVIIENHQAIQESSQV